MPSSSLTSPRCPGLPLGANRPSGAGAADATAVAATTAAIETRHGIIAPRAYYGPARGERYPAADLGKDGAGGDAGYASWRLRFATW